MKNITTTTDYPVGNGATPILLTVEIGNRQLGSSIVTHNLQIKDRGDNGQFDARSLGTADQLRGNTFRVKTVVTDEHDQSNSMSVGYRLTGGPQPASWSTGSSSLVRRSIRRG